MSQVVSFEDYTPPARFDATHWTQVRIEESDTTALSTATVWTQIDAITLSPVDSDPTNPATRDFTTNLASSTAALWYRVIFADAGGNTTLPSVPVQNLAPTVRAYATTEDLFRVLKVRNATEDRIDAAQGDLDSATIEINAEIDLAAGVTLTAEQTELCRGVCIDRAADLWRHRESIPGVLGGLDDIAQPMPGRYSFARYVARLSVIKDQWGIA